MMQSRGETTTNSPNPPIGHLVLLVGVKVYKLFEQEGQAASLVT